MSTYLFNNKRDQETNKLMGLVIFLILSLVFTIVISVSIFLVYFDDYINIQQQYTLLEEKLQKIRVENFEKISDYTRLNIELNQIKNEIHKLNLEKEVTDKNLKMVSNFIDTVNKGNEKDILRFVDNSVRKEFLAENHKKFPSEMISGSFVLNDDLKSGEVTYFHMGKDERVDRYVFDIVLRKDDWYISDVKVFEYKDGPESLINWLI